MANDDKFAQLLKQEIDAAWRDFCEATKGVSKVESVRDAVNLRTLCEHRLSAFNATFTHDFKICKELESIPAQVSDGAVDYGALCRSRWVRGREWILQLQALINEM